ncbi:MAG TPA: DUF3564 family protein, partial [Pirellulales bacterium]|nr:DUF3564 family protein [Pirellulales bacterium]
KFIAVGDLPTLCRWGTCHALRPSIVCPVAEINMRLSILLNVPASTTGRNYAVLWLDTVNDSWSLDAYFG